MSVRRSVLFTSVRIRVRITRCLTGGTANQTKQIWPLHMLATVIVRVALGTLLDEEFLAFCFRHFLDFIFCVSELLCTVSELVVSVI